MPHDVGLETDHSAIGACEFKYLHAWVKVNPNNPAGKQFELRPVLHNVAFCERQADNPAFAKVSVFVGRRVCKFENIRPFVTARLCCFEAMFDAVGTCAVQREHAAQSLACLCTEPLLHRWPLRWVSNGFVEFPRYKRSDFAKACRHFGKLVRSSGILRAWTQDHSWYFHSFGAFGYILQLAVQAIVEVCESSYYGPFAISSASPRDRRTKKSPK
jgi:hypothetical protein